MRDLSDPMVRDLAEHMHVPEETWSGGELTVTCAACGQSWPCETREQLRTMYGRK